jgi:ABC-2 type transport system ATP-binding protein
VTNAIETVDLARRFKGHEAVNALTLHVPAGSVFALVGPNGAGKTTTIKMLMNLIRPSSGSATVLGTDTRKLDPRDLQRIGYVSESQELPDWMTPDQLLAYVRPFYPTWDTALCEKLQRDLGLATRTPLKRLSRGTRMKAALLASLAYRPELLMLDEPFTGLDPLVRDELIRALLELPGERPFTVFVSSHDIDEVERLADWIGFLDRGRMVFAEPVSSLLDRVRLVEVVTPDGSSPTATMPSTWIAQGVAGRTLRFVDTQHDSDAAMTRIASAYPGADIRVAPLSLREIFVAVARRSAAPGTTLAGAS